MVENYSLEKIYGKYYTPKKLAQAIADWAITKPNLKILDPAFGKGALLEAALNTIEKIEGKKKYENIFGVEIDENSKEYLEVFRKNGAQESNFIIGDFLSLRVNESFTDHFDLVLGNPPFVRHHQIEEQLKSVAFSAMKEGDFNISRMAGYWAYFLLHSLSFLQNGGTLAMILPKSFISAKYSIKIRKIISECFESAAIHVLNERWFPDAEESVVILLAENYKLTKKNEIEDTYRNENKLISSVGGHYISKIQNTIENDWNYILAFLPHEIRKFIQSPCNKDNFVIIKDLVEIKIGVVTGANDFFILSKTKLEKLGINKKFLLPIITKSSLIKGLNITEIDKKLHNNNIRQYLILTSNDESKLPNNILEYLKEGEQEGLHQRYKCKNRTPWHLVKNTYSPDAFLHYISSSLPHIVLNQTSSTCTNAIHRLTWRKKINKNEKMAIGIASVTSLAQLSFEMRGRSYGGGVLKIEPSVALKILIPRYPKINVYDVYEKVNTALRTGEKETAMKIADEFILGDFLRLNSDFILNLRECWKNLVSIRQTSSRARAGL